jgi:ribosome-associated translation inhibitor RaiA
VVQAWAERKETLYVTRLDIKSFTIIGVNLEIVENTPEVVEEVVKEAAKVHIKGSDNDSNISSVHTDRSSQKAEANITIKHNTLQSNVLDAETTDSVKGSDSAVNNSKINNLPNNHTYTNTNSATASEYNSGSNESDVSRFHAPRESVYPNGSVLAHIKTMFMSTIQCKVGFADGTQSSHEIDKLQSWTFTACISGQTELNWEITKLYDNLPTRIIDL